MNRQERCRMGVVAGMQVDVACPNCGHTQHLHPGPHNPSLRACLLCDLSDLLERKERRTVSDEKLETLAEAIRIRLADETHQHLCACDAYPARCRYYTREGLAGGFTGVEDTLRVLNELGRLT